jgi:hypothetical protein
LDKDALIKALAQKLPQKLSEDVVNEFVQIRQDVATDTLGRSSGGKFVETIVQILQFLDTGQYDDTPPKPDNYLNTLESKAPSLDDGLRICAARIARSMYTLRNKRNMQHKGSVDPNSYDLRFVHHGAQWLLAELLRQVSGLTMQEAGQLINMANAPVGELVEDTGFRRLVLHDTNSPAEEVLVLLHSHYGTVTSLKTVQDSLNRRTDKEVRNALASLWKRKLVDGAAKHGYVLTTTGFNKAVEVIRRVRGEG